MERIAGSISSHKSKHVNARGDSKESIQSGQARPGPSTTRCGANMSLKIRES
ncbi:hypothetical protein NEUTE1DRAFT_116767 [Neurospora tetrasperma FGSC 2508]|uniref:Uncharacterized protein n=1 Tax=Neurospora tetrasperma (strain FGSC 2508 / ATCC MYA-4615 / P0657) TaxID=510951 RepID=F8MJX2_NEUT8|nr:uncharacterized protein NEUTE1DRAFT_116767 [Neurospora tetrasperma FGSC 2508]EGO57309.1 hypothetical protein NEUTE1DRAFT_116767 [Neurospora tetrasperma FGSC 2508]EGZ72439.1 hypothetical protein NEUTE2DRAFT_144840 [Neurospora tetrasperma FGSC 2509]